MNSWIFLIPSIVFSKVKNNFSETIKTKYNMGDSNFSTVDSQNKDAVFPFVYIHLLPAVETGRDLEGIEINGGLFTFQVSVWSNKSQSATREVMSEVLRIMKTMRFDVVSMPEFVTKDVYESVARFRRNISKNDVL